MNPQFHDEFMALCALFYSGDITDEEWALLQIHMGYCDVCHDKFLEYERISRDVVPALAAAAASQVKDIPEGAFRAVDDAEQRLMRKLESRRRELRPVLQPTARWWVPIALLAACLIGAAIFLGFHRIREQKIDLAGNRQKVEKPAIATPSSIGVGDQDALKRTQDAAAKLQSQLLIAEGRLRESNVFLAEAQHRMAAEQAQSKQIAEERDNLRDQLNAARSDAETLRRASSADADKTQQTMRIAELETKIRDLNAALEDKSTALNEKDRMLALDAEFLAHDRDIRDLIGARNLYISDIVDMTEDGRTAKQFGRIFYTKDRSLVFYGFDLDKQAGLRRDASFQAWGRGSHQDSPVSLGLFYQDDGHKRWVLRCNDAKTLARLDMVFVTMEPPGGSSKPTGKPLLRAYLQIEPNHR